MSLFSLNNVFVVFFKHIIMSVPLSLTQQYFIISFFGITSEVVSFGSFLLASFLTMVSVKIEK